VPIEAARAMHRTATCACGITTISVNGEPERHFCKNCGTTLFWYISTLPDSIGIAGGCFTDDGLGEPVLSVTHGKKVAWLQLPPGWKTQD